MRLKKPLIALLSIFLILVSCSAPQGSSTLEGLETTSMIVTEQIIPYPGESTITATPFQPVFEPQPQTIYWSPAVPQAWIQELKGVEVVENPDEADIQISISTPSTDSVVFGSFERILVVGVPFPTVTDAISLEDIQSIWRGQGTASGEFSILMMTNSTEIVLSELWGKPNGESIGIFSKDEIVTELWNSTNALAIIPFEDIEPRLKILRVNGISPLDRPMNTVDYPLTVKYSLSGNGFDGDEVPTEIAQILSFIPVTNRDESKMTVVVMSGTTALARVTLNKIELKGYEYPVELVKDWFLSADLRHVSNEVAFNQDCQYTDPYTMRFCSKPDQIKVLEILGINVVESTGNHLNDYEGDSFANTLQMYQDRGWINFGGGLNAELAKQSATTEVNGNRIAFIGCNSVGPETSWATDTKAGSAKCDYAWYNQKISDLKSQGYVVIATFQYDEISLPMFDKVLRAIFYDAANAGADIIQGSQAHVPMGFEFVGNSLIHYGLGNFLFDQMKPENIREFIDRHIIYDGRYISTEILTATLTDWSKPIPMSDADREDFLRELFEASRMR